MSRQIDSIVTTAIHSAHPVLAPPPPHSEGVLPALALMAILLPAFAWRNGTAARSTTCFIYARSARWLCSMPLRFIDHKLVADSAVIQHFPKFSSHSALAVFAVCDVVRISQLAYFDPDDRPGGVFLGDRFSWDTMRLGGRLWNGRIHSAAERALPHATVVAQGVPRKSKKPRPVVRRSFYIEFADGSVGHCGA